MKRLYNLQLNERTEGFLLPVKTVCTMMLSFFVATVSLNGMDTYTMEPSTLKKIGQKYGPRAKKRVESLLNLMNKIENYTEPQKVKAVNDFFNRVFYQTDIKTWNEKDYWATRMEFLGKAKGDCEDYAIAKYFTLRQLGVPEKKLFMTYVKLKKLNQAHMVITYFHKPKKPPYVLDNYNIKILPATKRTDLVPVYSFNGSSLYLAKQEGLGKSSPGSQSKNVKWLRLLSDIKRNKL